MFKQLSSLSISHAEYAMILLKKLHSVKAGMTAYTHTLPTREVIILSFCASHDPQISVISTI